MPELLRDHTTLRLGGPAQAWVRATTEPELVSLGCKFTSPVVVPAEGGVDVEVAGEAKEPVDGLTTVSLTVTSGGQKVLGMPKAVVRVPSDA